MDLGVSGENTFTVTKRPSQRFKKSGTLYIESGLFTKKWKARFIDIDGECVRIKRRMEDAKDEYTLMVGDITSIDAIDEYNDLSFKIGLATGKFIVLRGSEDEDPQEWVRYLVMWRNSQKKVKK